MGRSPVDMKTAHVLPFSNDAEIDVGTGEHWGDVPPKIFQKTKCLRSVVLSTSMDADGIVSYSSPRVPATSSLKTSSRCVQINE